MGLALSAFLIGYFLGIVVILLIDVTIHKGG
jgi:hypothetical protein